MCLGAGKSLSLSTLINAVWRLGYECCGALGAFENLREIKEIKKSKRVEKKRDGEAAGENEGGGLRAFAVSAKDYAGALEGSDW